MYVIECYTGLPIDYESFLLKKYDSFITSCYYINVFFPTHDVNYLLFLEGDQLKELIVYGIEDNMAICFNSLVKIDESIMSLSIDKIFERHPLVKKIKVDASYSTYSFKKSILYFKSDDYILDLPISMDEYYKRLSTNTRQHVKNRKTRLLRDYPTAKIVVKYKMDIERDLLLRIMDLSRGRHLSKGRLNSIDNIYFEKLFDYLKHYGCVAYIELDGVVIAGNITSVSNKAIFGHVMAHDNSFSRYSLGEICAVYVIQTAIENNLTSFHFLWGRSDLKTRLLSEKCLLYSYVIFRTKNINYYLTKIEALCTHGLKKIKQAPFSIPFKNALKIYRRIQNSKFNN